MTNFLDSDLAASKANRKERRGAANRQGSAAAEHAIASCQKALEKDFKKADNLDRGIAKAINDAMPELIAAMDENALAPFFFGFERLATGANRRRIAQHALHHEVRRRTARIGGRRRCSRRWGSGGGGSRGPEGREAREAGRIQFSYAERRRAASPN